MSAAKAAAAVASGASTVTGGIPHADAAVITAAPVVGALAILDMITSVVPAAMTAWLLEGYTHSVRGDGEAHSFPSPINHLPPHRPPPRCARPGTARRGPCTAPSPSTPPSRTRTCCSRTSDSRRRAVGLLPSHRPSSPPIVDSPTLRRATSAWLRARWSRPSRSPSPCRRRRPFCACAPPCRRVG